MLEITLTQTACLLVATHFMCDYPLQGAYLAETKAKGPLRLWHLFGHSAIHGAGVGLVTGSTALGLAETAAHMAIDELKVRGLIGFRTDQALHMACKATWVAAMALGIA